MKSPSSVRFTVTSRKTRSTPSVFAISNLEVPPPCHRNLAVSSRHSIAANLDGKLFTRSADALDLRQRTIAMAMPRDSEERFRVFC